MTQFVVTNAGLAAAAAASPTGPFINITQFRLGDNYSTAAAITDTNLIGNTVYTGIPTSFSFFDSQTIQINMEIPATAGPFDYGEVGIYMTGGILFARMSYGALRTKSDSSVAGYANTLRIKALLRLAQGPSVFNFSPGTSQSVLELSSFQVLQTPNDNPANPMVIVHEANDFQESVVLFKDSATLWNICNYTKIGTATITAAPSTTQLTAAFFGTLLTPVNSRGRYLIQTQGGYVRQVSTVTGSTMTLTSSINTAALVGQSISIYQSDLTRVGEIYTAVTNLQSQIASMVFYLGNATLSGSNYTVAAGSFPPVGMFSVRFSASNPVNATMNINGTGARPLQDPFGNALQLGSISANETRSVVFNGAAYIVRDPKEALLTKDFIGAGNQVLGTATDSYSLGVGITLPPPFATSGYQRLPGGLLLQTGTMVLGDLPAGPNSQAVSFPTPFQSRVIVPPTFSCRDGSTTPTILQSWDLLTLTGFTWKFYEVGPHTQNSVIYYSVIGI